MAKKIAPAAIVALKEALTHLYWYKSDLRSFLTTTLATPSLLTQLNWDDYKRNVVGTLIDFLVKRPDQYQGDLLRLMSEVSRASDFSHLERLEGGAEKASKARASVRALEKLTRGHDALAAEEEKVEERRRQAHEQLLRTTAVRNSLESFARWQAGEKLPDDALCNAVKEMENGLVDADLGGFLYKKRVARPGGGKSGGYRTILSARIGERYVFLHGFAKKDKANCVEQAH